VKTGAGRKQKKASLQLVTVVCVLQQFSQKDFSVTDVDFSYLFFS